MVQKQIQNPYLISELRRTAAESGTTNTASMVPEQVLKSELPKKDDEMILEHCPSSSALHPYLVYQPHLRQDVHLKRDRPENAASRTYSVAPKSHRIQPPVLPVVTTIRLWKEDEVLTLL